MVAVIRRTGVEVVVMETYWYNGETWCVTNLGGVPLINLTYDEDDLDDVPDYDECMMDAFAYTREVA